MMSILVHNHNRASALDRCLASVAAQRLRPLELVLLDAGSTDGSRSVIDEAKETLRSAGIRASIGDCARLGVAESRNLLARKATGSLLFFLDNDATVEGDDGLELISRRFEAEPGLGLVACRALRRESDEVDPGAWVFRRPPSEWQGRRFSTFTFTGGCFLVRREAFLAAGGFWEVLAYAREEEDLALAMLDRGWTIGYDPVVTIRHYPEEAGRMSPSERKRVELRNGVMVIFRRLPLPLVPLAVAARLLTMSVAARRDRRSLRALWAALPDARRLWREQRCARDPVGWRAIGRYLALHRRKRDPRR
jgi:N-acetylglucosaminyl-diphospho-decaprenol L-rhamnosyltransferase